MKKIALITLLWGVASSAMAFNAPPQADGDSIIILFGKKTRIAIRTDDKAELQALKNYDLNALLGQVIEVREKTEHKAGRDTTLIINDDTVVVKDNQVIIKDKEKRIVTFSIKIGGENGEGTAADGSRAEPKQRRMKRTHSEWFLDLGLNNYLTNGQFTDQSEPYTLRPLGSRYVALSYISKTRIGGAASPLAISYGGELSFYNFMFDSNQRIFKGTNAVEFRELQSQQGQTISLRKNKLTVVYASLPVMLTLDFGQGGRNWRTVRSGRAGRTGEWSVRAGSRDGFRLGAGGFVGYRLNSYSKIREEDGPRDRDRSNYYLNNIRYGAQAMLGFGSIDLFFKYDLSPLFADNQGPANTDLRSIAFGLRF